MSDYLRHEATLGNLYRCPTDGRPIAAMRGDDKVLCNCRKSNPAVPEEETERTGTHIVRYLIRMSRDEYEIYLAAYGAEYLSHVASLVRDAKQVVNIINCERLWRQHHPGQRVPSSGQWEAAFRSLDMAPAK